jgi:predicted transcriptional regulator
VNCTTAIRVASYTSKIRNKKPFTFLFDIYSGGEICEILGGFILLTELFERIFRDGKPHPSFGKAHILIVLLHIASNEPIGRYKLSKELAISDSSVRTIIKYLKEIGLVNAIPKQGHVLSSEGRQFIKEIKKELIEIRTDLSLKELTMGTFDTICQLRNAALKVKTGVELRDEAIKVGADGATTIIFEKNTLFIPPKPIEDLRKSNKDIHNMLTSNFDIQEGDVFIVGTASDRKKATEAAIASVLTLLLPE